MARVAAAGALRPVRQPSYCPHIGAVRIFFTIIQGRTFGAPGLTALAGEQCGRRKRSRGRTARVTRRRGPGVHPGSRRCGAAVFAASFGRKPYGAATAARGGPGDRPPAVPAVSRCRARQHHGQTVTLVPDAPIAMRCHRNRAGAMPRIVRAGPSSLTVLRIPLRGTRLRRAVDPGDLCQPSGPYGEGQARGQARLARSEPPQIDTAPASRTETRTRNRCRSRSRLACCTAPCHAGCDATLRLGSWPG